MKRNEVEGSHYQHFILHNGFPLVIIVTLVIGNFKTITISFLSAFVKEIKIPKKTATKYQKYIIAKDWLKCLLIWSLRG